MQTKNEIYQNWKVGQLAKANEFYADPFSKAILAEDLIAYKHKALIGGSVNSILLGVNRYQSKADAYDDMINFKPNESKFVFRRGHWAEDFIANEFSRIIKCKVLDGTEIDGTKKGRAWSFAQIDKLLPDGTPVEIKTANFNTDSLDGEKEWGKGCDINNHGLVVVEDSLIPVEYYVQCQKQLWATDKDYMYLCAWLMNEVKIRVYIIRRDDEIIQQILDSEDDFLFNHVIPQVPYEKDILPLENTVDEKPDTVYADNLFLDTLSEYKQVQAELSEKKKQADELSNKLKDLIGEHKEVIDNDGNKLASLTTVKTKRFNTAKLKDDLPAIYIQFLSESESSRLTIAKDKKK